jgi:RNA polymerase sigma-70 factor (ECF subfamily)
MTAIVGTADEGDTSLLALAAAGDEAAFASIVAANQAHMSRVAFLVSGDLDVADDAVAAAWRIAWRRLGSVRESAKLRSWLMTVTANEARQLCRRRRRVASREVVIEAGMGAAVPDPSLRVGDLDLEDALARLDPDDRVLLALRYVAGFDATELGRATGRSASGTRARLARLLARLREDLGDDDV